MSCPVYCGMRSLGVSGRGTARVTDSPPVAQRHDFDAHTLLDEETIEPKRGRSMIAWQCDYRWAGGCFNFQLERMSFARLVRGERSSERYFVAAEDVPTKTVVASEVPLAHSFLNYDRQCDGCLRPARTRNAVPCQKCRQVTYCSTACRKLHKLKHRLECPLLTGLPRALRTTTRGSVWDQTEFRGLVVLLARLILYIAKEEPSALRDNLPPTEWEERLREIWDGEGCPPVSPALFLSYRIPLEGEGEVTRETDEIAWVCLRRLLEQSRECYRKARVVNPLDGIVMSEEMVKTLTHRISIDSCAITDDVVECGRMRAGAAVYTYTSFLPHSCVPNVYLRNNAGKTEIVAMRPLRAGEPLTLCHKSVEDCAAESRLEHHHFMFVCHCERCSAIDEAVRRIRAGESVPRHEIRLCNGSEATGGFLVSEFGERSSLAVDTDDPVWAWYARDLALGGMVCPREGCSSLCLPWRPEAGEEFPLEEDASTVENVLHVSSRGLLAPRQWVCEHCGLLPSDDGSRDELERTWERFHSTVQSLPFVLVSRPDGFEALEQMWDSITQFVPPTHEFFFRLASTAHSLQVRQPMTHTWWARGIRIMDIIWGISAPVPFTAVDYAAHRFIVGYGMCPETSRSEAVLALEKALEWAEILFTDDHPGLEKLKHKLQTRLTELTA